MSVRGNYMTRDERAQAFFGLLQEHEADVESLPAGPAKTFHVFEAALLHRILERIARRALRDGMIQPFDGTNKPPQEP